MGLRQRFVMAVTALVLTTVPAHAVIPVVEVQKLTAADAATENLFGVSVSVSNDGSTALSGAGKRNSFAGAAYVFTRSGSAWTQQQALTAGDTEANDYFGISVSLSSDGNTALVGAQGKSSSAGAAYVFTRSGGVWTQQQKLTASDFAANDLFGISVSLSSDGNTALIGARGKSTSTGAAYVFTRSGTTWTEKQKLTASDYAVSDYFGLSVSLSGDGATALVGANRKNSNTGAAYVFTLSGGVWSQQQKLTATDGAANDYFGISVSLSGDGNKGLIGAHGVTSFTGAAYVFTRSGSTWTQQQKLAASDAATFDYFGYSVSLASNGNRALVGADAESSSAGAAYLFDYSSSWTEQKKLAASDAASFDYFGFAVSLGAYGNTALVGADGKSTNTGAAYVYRIVKVCNGGEYDNYTDCTPCAAGTYQTAGSNLSCLPAPVGSYVAGSGASSYTQCLPGTFQVAVGQTSCNSCPAGKYQNLVGQDDCFDAAPGHYVPDPGAAAYIPCPAGNYQPIQGQTSCLACPATTCQPATGMTSCINCAAGTSSYPGQTACLPYCDAGKYYDGSACTQCLPGTYQTAGFNTACLAAPAGTFVAAAGASSPTPCAAGTYQNLTAATSCTACPASTWQPATGQSSCLTIAKAATGIVVDTSTSPATIYAGIDTAGVYKSIDNTTWNPANGDGANTLANLRVKALARSSAGTLYAATYGSGVFKSTDGGANWGACSTVNLTNLNIVSLTIDAGGKLYAGTEAGVFVSSDSCGTWTAINGGLP